MNAPRIFALGVALLAGFTGLYLLIAAGRIQRWVCSNPERLARLPWGGIYETPLFRWYLRLCGMISLGVSTSLVRDVISLVKGAQ